MMSELTEAIVVNVAVLGAVLISDVGPARKIGAMRILRPLVVAGVLVPLFVRSPQRTGYGLKMEVAGTVLGLLLGLLVVSAVGVYRNPKTGKPASRAGLGYAVLWTMVIGARTAFSYGCVHWFPEQLVRFGVAHDITVAGLADTLIFMAIAMLIARTLMLWARAAMLPRAA